MGSRCGSWWAVRLAVARRRRPVTFDNRKGRGTKYGAQHQAERKRRLSTVRPGDPCGYCGQPLPTNTSTWHLPHSPDGLTYLPGMWHTACNLREAAIRGARKTNAQRKQGRPRPRFRPLRDW